MNASARLPYVASIERADTHHMYIAYQPLHRRYVRTDRPILLQNGSTNKAISDGAEGIPMNDYPVPLREFATVPFKIALHCNGEETEGQRERERTKAKLCSESLGMENQS